MAVCPWRNALPQTAPFAYRSAHRPSWGEFSSRFIDQKECLASYLALEAAEVLEGAKPANLIGIPNRRRSCGRNLYLLWKDFGHDLIAGSGLVVRELANRGDSVLLLLYSRRALGDQLARPAVSTILRKAGYPKLSEVDTVLDEMAQRISGDSFPHEIGIFLGYPLKDVAAFMGLASIPFSCQGPWKIFGNPRDSLLLAERFRCCRLAMAERLATGTSPFACLGRAYEESGAFSCHADENDYQFPRLACASH